MSFSPRLFIVLMEGPLRPRICRSKWQYVVIADSVPKNHCATQRDGESADLAVTFGADTTQQSTKEMCQMFLPDHVCLLGLSDVLAFFVGGLMWW